MFSFTKFFRFYNLEYRGIRILQIKLSKFQIIGLIYSSSIPQLIHIFFDCISNHVKLWTYPFLHSIEILLEVRRIWKLLSIITSIKHWKIKTIKISSKKNQENIYFSTALVYWIFQDSFEILLWYVYEHLNPQNDLQIPSWFLFK